MAGVTFSLTDDNTDKIIAEKNEAVERALEIIGGKAMGYASGLSPVDTGRLAGSITWATQMANGGGPPGDSTPQGIPEEGTVYVGTNVEYAEYQEFGTSRMSAANGGRGYIGPAIQEHLDEYKKILEQELSDSVR